MWGWDVAERPSFELAHSEAPQRLGWLRQIQPTSGVCYVEEFFLGSSRLNLLIDRKMTAAVLGVFRRRSPHIDADERIVVRNGQNCPERRLKESSKISKRLKMAYLSERKGIKNGRHLSVRVHLKQDNLHEDTVSQVP